MLNTHLIIGLSPSQRGAFIQHLQSLIPCFTVVNISQRPVLTLGACLCCRMHNETSEALRHLFMQALQRRTAKFSHVLLDCQAGVEASSVVYTLQQDFFLKERFRYTGTVLVLCRDFIEKVLHDKEAFSTYFATSRLIVFDENNFVNKQEFEVFSQRVNDIYVSLRLFNPELSLPTIMPINAVTEKVWVDYQSKSLNEPSKPLHRFFI